MLQGALDKWEALPPDVKLKYNQKLAIHGARLHEIQKMKDNKERKLQAHERKEKEKEEKGMMWQLKPKPAWEVEWDSMRKLTAAKPTASRPRPA